MTNQRRRDTGPEIALRRELHARGLRYRVDAETPAGVRRRADLVFSRAQVAVFVDGCFWHRCPLHGTNPRSNAEWWRAKLDANVARDRDTDALLERAGWSALHVWEHEEPVKMADAVESEVRRRTNRA